MGTHTLLCGCALGLVSLSTARHIYTERFGYGPSAVDLKNTKIVFSPKGKDSGKNGYDICTSQASRLAFEPEYVPEKEGKNDAIISPTELTCECDTESDIPGCNCVYGSSCCTDLGYCSAVQGKCYDDEYGEIAFEKAFNFYGEDYTSVYVNVNGQLTFDEPSTVADETLHEHFAHSGVAVLFDDFMTQDTLKLFGWDEQYPDQVADVGRIYHRALAASESKQGGIVVTWVRVPQYESSIYYIDTNLNTFQVALEYDGTITLSYLTLTTSDGIVGLSDGGGLEDFFVPIDLSSCHYSDGTCGAVRDDCVTQPGGVAKAVANGENHWSDGKLSAVEGFQICSFLLLLGCFALVLFLAWPGLIKPGGPLGMVGSVAPGGGGGGGIAFTGSLNGGGGVPPRGAANGDYGQMSMSEDSGYEAPLTASAQEI